MNNLVTALRHVERKLANEKGEFALFACFQPADMQDQWDVIISAPWAPRHNKRILKLLVSELDNTLLPPDRRSIALVVVEPSAEDVQRLNARFTGNGGPWEIRNEEYFGYVVAQGFVIASNDYWRFVKELFPKKANFVFFDRDGDLHIRVSWHLGTDPHRPNKSSRIIIIRISREVLDDYIYIDEPRQHVAERQLVTYLKDRLRSYNPEHTKSPYETPPVEEWRVTTNLFQRPAAMA